MVSSDYQQLTWADDGSDDEHSYSIPQLIDPYNLVEDEEEYQASDRLEDERQELIDEVVQLNNKLRDLAIRYKELKDFHTSEQNVKGDTENSLTLAIMNTQYAEVDLFFGREPPANVPRNNEVQRLSKYLLGSSQESKYRGFVKGDSSNNFKHEYSFGKIAKVYRKPGEGHTDEKYCFSPNRKLG